MKTKHPILTLAALTAFAASAPAALLSNGGFDIYKPGTGYTVAGTLTGTLFQSYVQGVGDARNVVGAIGTVTWDDATTGSTADLPGWVSIHGGNPDTGTNGVGGSEGLNIFAAWGGQQRVQSTVTTAVIAANTTYTITAQIDGPAGGPIEGGLAFHLVAGNVQLTADAALPSFTGGVGFQTITRTYTIAALPDGVSAGDPLTVVLGVEDTNTLGNRMIWDDVVLEVVSSPLASDFQVIITPTAGSPGNYDFEWESQAGKLYDLVSATDLSTASNTWPVWNGRADLTATPPTNTLTDIPGGGDPRRFFVLIEKDAPPPPPLLAVDFESGTPGGWVFSDNGAGTAWSVGTPNGTGTEPDAAANGTQCAGTNMNGNYTASAIASLVTPAFTVPAGGATLKFSQYIDTEVATGGGDFGSIRLLNAADNTPLLGGDVSADIQGISELWSSKSLPLPAAANGLEVKLEFRFESDADADVFAGFYIDDVVVEVGAP
jgi:hypothetical protein